MLKNITLSAEEHLIAAARARAARENTTLNAEFREWLEEYGEEVEQDEALKEKRIKEYRELMERIHKSGFRGPGRKLTRQEMNER